MKAENIKYLVVHCADTPNGRDDTAEDIHGWHLARGWDGVGYHFVIRPGGLIERGRPTYWKGSHVRGHNHESIGICLDGRDQFDDGQLHGLRELLGELLTKFTNAKPVGHNELDSHKTCPNFDVQEWWKHG